MDKKDFKKLLESKQMNKQNQSFKDSQRKGNVKPLTNRPMRRGG